MHSMASRRNDHASHNSYQQYMTWHKISKTKSRWTSSCWTLQRSLIKCPTDSQFRKLTITKSAAAPTAGSEAFSGTESGRSSSREVFWSSDSLFWSSTRQVMAKSSGRVATSHISYGKTACYVSHILTNYDCYMKLVGKWWNNVSWDDVRIPSVMV